MYNRVHYRVARSNLATVGVLKEDKEILDKNNVKLNQDFIHRAVRQFVKNKEDSKEILSLQIEKNTPSFLFTDKTTNEELYTYLKEDPSASRFIFKKYTADQSFLRELCDPENPIYLEEVAKNLQNIYQVKEEEKNIRELQEERSRLERENEKLRKEIEEAEKEYDMIFNNLDAVKKEDENYNMQRSNIRTGQGLGSDNEQLHGRIKAPRCRTPEVGCLFP